MTLIKKTDIMGWNYLRNYPGQCACYNFVTMRWETFSEFFLCCVYMIPIQMSSRNFILADNLNHWHDSLWTYPSFPNYIISYIHFTAYPFIRVIFFWKILFIFRLEDNFTFFSTFWGQLWWSCEVIDRLFKINHVGWFDGIWLLCLFPSHHLIQVSYVFMLAPSI